MKVDIIDQHKTNGGEFTATTDMLFDGDNFKGGKPLDENGKPEDSTSDDPFWHSSDHIIPVFGGDDGSITIPLEWARWAIDNNKRKLRIRISPNQVSLIQK